MSAETDAGYAGTARDKLEELLQAEGARLFAVFLDGVYADALAADTLTAAADPNKPARAFSLGTVRERWRQFSTDAAWAAGSWAVHTVDTANEISNRLQESQLAGAVWESLQVARQSAFTPAQLREVLSPLTPSLLTSVDGVIKQGSEWGSVVEQAMRTEATGIYSREQLSAGGVFRWVARHDGRTRWQHSMTDGQKRSAGTAFNVAGVPMLYPGDPSAPYELRVNCRCVLHQVQESAQIPPMDAELALPLFGFHVERTGLMAPGDLARQEAAAVTEYWYSPVQPWGVETARQRKMRPVWVSLPQWRKTTAGSSAAYADTPAGRITAVDSHIARRQLTQQSVGYSPLQFEGEVGTLITMRAYTSVSMSKLPGGFTTKIILPEGIQLNAVPDFADKYLLERNIKLRIIDRTATTLVLKAEI